MIANEEAWYMNDHLGQTSAMQLILTLATELVIHVHYLLTINIARSESCVLLILLEQVRRYIFIQTTFLLGYLLLWYLLWELAEVHFIHHKIILALDEVGYIYRMRTSSREVAGNGCMMQEILISIQVNRLAGQTVEPFRWKGLKCALRYVYANEF